MTPTLAALLAHIENCTKCSSRYRCSHAVAMAQAWSDAMVAKMEPRSAVKA